VVFAVVATAVALALTDRSEAAVKVALFAILLPAPPFMGALFVLIVKSPDWYRSAETFLGAVVCGAAGVFVLAFLIWLPFSPDRWQFDEVPTVLRLPMLAGVVAFAVGGALSAVIAVPVAWRRGDRKRAAEYVIALGVIAWPIVSVVSRRPSG
jgi:hypothetical protein